MPQQGHTDAHIRPGRLDDLALSLVDKLADHFSGNPVVASMFPVYRPLLETVTRAYLGPDVGKVLKPGKRKHTRKGQKG